MKLAWHEIRRALPTWPWSEIRRLQETLKAERAAKWTLAESAALNQAAADKIALTEQLAKACEERDAFQNLEIKTLAMANNHFEAYQQAAEQLAAAVTRAEDAEESMARWSDACVRMDRDLSRIAALETPNCASIGKRMAKIARGEG